jgi:hypothetical protein
MRAQSTVPLKHAEHTHPELMRILTPEHTGQELMRALSVRVRN